MGVGQVSSSIYYSRNIKKVVRKYFEVLSIFKVNIMIYVYSDFFLKYNENRIKLSYV